MRPLIGKDQFKKPNRVNVQSMRGLELPNFEEFGGVGVILSPSGMINGAESEGRSTSFHISPWKLKNRQNDNSYEPNYNKLMSANYIGLGIIPNVDLPG